MSAIGPKSDTENCSELRLKCKEVASTPAGDTQKLASLFSQMSICYYEDVRRHSRKSFNAAMAAGIVGTLIFLVGVCWAIMGSNGGMVAHLGMIAGVVVQVISGINFYLYTKTSQQFSLFHVCLERMNRFLLANSLCENIVDVKKKDAGRMELARSIVNAPMLSLDGTPGRSGESPESTSRRSAPRPRRSEATSIPAPVSPGTHTNSVNSLP